MIDIKDITIDNAWGEIRAQKYGIITATALTKTINKIAAEVEKKAREFAPLGTGFAGGGNITEIPGRLKAEGILRFPTTVEHIEGDFGTAGSVVEDFPAFGGGFTVRGGNLANRGQFSGVSKFEDPGHVFLGGGSSRTVVSARVILNPSLDYAKWVHQGTGVYGPLHKPITPQVSPYLRFRWMGRRWKKRSVRGQPPQPFLTEAYAYVNNVYAPVKTSELGAELRASL